MTGWPKVLASREIRLHGKANRPYPARRGLRQKVDLREPITAP